jgi:hypothetical protein
LPRHPIRAARIVAPGASLLALRAPFDAPISSRSSAETDILTKVRNASQSVLKRAAAV